MSAFWWALLTAFIWGVVPLMEKIGLGTQVNPTVGVIVRSLGVTLGMLVFGCFWSAWSSIRTMSGVSIFLLAGGGFIASFIGQLAFYRALQNGSVSQVTPVAGAYPLVAALLGWTLLREPLTLTRLLGVMLIVFGVVLLRR